MLLGHAVAGGYHVRCTRLGTSKRGAEINQSCRVLQPTCIHHHYSGHAKAMASSDQCPYMHGFAWTVANDFEP